MSAKRGVVLGEKHRLRVERGEISLSGLADEMHVSRQNLHQLFTRKSWKTTAVLDTSPAGSKAEPTMSIAAPTEPVESRSAPQAVDAAPTASRVLAAPASASPATQATHGEFVEAINEQLVNAMLLVVGRAQEQLAQPRVGPAGIKALAAALALANGELTRLGYGTPAEAQLAVLRIEEFTSAELEDIQNTVERAYHAPDIDDDDDEIDDDDTA